MSYNSDLYIARWTHLGNKIVSISAPAIRTMSSLALGGSQVVTWTALIERLANDGRIPPPPKDKGFIQKLMDNADIGHLYEDPDDHTPAPEPELPFVLIFNEPVTESLVNSLISSKLIRVFLENNGVTFSPGRKVDIEVDLSPVPSSRQEDIRLRFTCHSRYGGRTIVEYVLMPRQFRVLLTSILGIDPTEMNDRKKIRVFCASPLDNGTFEQLISDQDLRNQLRTQMSAIQMVAVNTGKASIGAAISVNDHDRRPALVFKWHIFGQRGSFVFTLPEGKRHQLTQFLPPAVNVNVADVPRTPIHCIMPLDGELLFHMIPYDKIVKCLRQAMSADNVQYQLLSMVDAGEVRLEARIMDDGFLETDFAIEFSWKYRHDRRRKFLIHPSNDNKNLLGEVLGSRRPAPAPPAPPAPSAGPFLPASDPMDVDTTTDPDLCVICLASKIGTVFLECGHTACCTDCAGMVDTCPICRLSITRVVRTFNVW